MDKFAYIRKVENKYVVFSRKGKQLGSYDTKSEAIKRLKQIEYFKHKNASNNESKELIDLTKIDDFSYSAICRKLKDNYVHQRVFQHVYKKLFDEFVSNDKEINNEEILLKTISLMQKKYEIKIKKDIIKEASAIELGDPKKAGKQIADIIKFLLKRISPKNRLKSIISLSNKIYNLSADEIAGKKVPPSSSMGQSITFVKNILLDHDPQYIRSVLNNIAFNLTALDTSSTEFSHADDGNFADDAVTEVRDSFGDPFSTFEQQHLSWAPYMNYDGRNSAELYSHDDYSNKNNHDLVVFENSEFEVPQVRKNRKSICIRGRICKFSWWNFKCLRKYEKDSPSIKL